MNRTTLKKNKPELFKAMLGLDISIKKLNRNVAHLWAINEHRCPVCHRAITDPKEIEFMEEVGECGTCDHVRADVEGYASYKDYEESELL